MIPPRRSIRFACSLTLGLLLIGVPAVEAGANEASVRRLVETKLRDGSVESVSRARVGPLYEVVVRTPEGLRIYYVDAAVTAIFSGELMDARTGRNLTEERIRTLGAIKWSSLPFDWSFKVVHGSGRRQVAVFSDPNCPYCRKLESDLAALGDVTVHVFMYPIISPASKTLTISVWCSADRARAWDELMRGGVRPPVATCDSPVDRIVAHGRSLGAKSTPTWFVPSGERYEGALPLEKLRSILDAQKHAK